MIKKLHLLLFIIVLVGFFLRVTGIRCGLPSYTGRLTTFHFDEYITFDAISKMDPQKLNFYPTDALYWGTFQVYLQAIILKFMEQIGLFKVQSKEWFKKNLYMADRMYISGRLITIIFSTLSIIVLYFVSKLLLSGYFVLIPPLFLSISYVEIYIAGFVKPDVIMLFWGLCSFYFIVKSFQSDFDNKDILLSAIFNGLSFASKYTGAAFFLNFILFQGEKLLIREKKYSVFLKMFLLYLLVVFIVFVMINPYFILRNSDVILYMKVIYSKTISSCSILKGYFEFFWERMPASIGWLLWLFSITGVIYSFIKRKKEIVLISLFVISYIFRFEHNCDNVITYSLPIIPFLALISGYFVEKVFNKNIFFKIFIPIVFIYSFFYSYYHKSLWNKDTTLLKASLWIDKNIGKDKSICLSRLEIWVPPILRKYDTPYERLFIASKQDVSMEKSVEFLSNQLNSCDYLVLSEFEKIIIKEKKLKNLENRINEKFEIIKKFDRQRSPFFIFSESKHYLTANIINPDIYIFKKK